MSGIAIERRGKDQVIEGFALHKTPFFSVWQKKDLKFSNIDEDEQEALTLLSDNLDAIEACGSQLVYTIRFHKKLDPDAEIKSNTPYHGSFNFKVCDNQGYAQSMSGLVPGVMPERFQPVPNQLIMQQLQKMQDEITQLRAQPVATEEPLSEMDKWADRIDAVGAIIEKQPVLAQLLQMGIGKIFGINVNVAPGGISGIPDEEKDEQINTSLEVLKANDPKLADHLVKLANMAINEPDKFKMLIGML